jgi:hypothetical protein
MHTTNGTSEEHGAQPTPPPRVLPLRAELEKGVEGGSSSDTSKDEGKDDGHGLRSAKPKGHDLLCIGPPSGGVEKQPSSASDRLMVS